MHNQRTACWHCLEEDDQIEVPNLNELMARVSLNGTPIFQHETERNRKERKETIISNQN